MAKHTYELVLSNTIDTVAVNGRYEVVGKAVIYTQMQLVVDGQYDIPLEKVDVNLVNCDECQHRIDTDQIFMLFGMEGAHIYKNSSVQLIASGYYDKERYTCQAVMKLVPITKEVVIKVVPNVETIVVDKDGIYNPQGFSFRLNHIFDGKETLMATYEDYRLTYSFSDNLGDETEYELALTPLVSFDFLRKEKRYPDYMMGHLYKDKTSIIPEYSFRLPINRMGIRHDSVYMADLTNEVDNVVTDSEYYLTEERSVSTTVMFFCDNKQIPILFDDNMEYALPELSIKPADMDEEEYITNIGFDYDLNKAGELTIKLTFPDGARIPKKFYANIKIYAKYPTSNEIIDADVTYTVNAIPSVHPIYELQPNASAIRVNADKIKDPITIGCDCYMIRGNRRTLTDYGFILYSVDGGSPMLYEGPLDTEHIMNNVVFEYFAGDQTFLDREMIYVVYDGTDGEEATGPDETSQHRYYLATDYDENSGKIPGTGESWIADKYPDASLFNEKWPYLWMYERTVNVYKSKGQVEVFATNPVVIQKYVKGVSDQTEYYFATTHNEGVQVKVEYDTDGTVMYRAIHVIDDPEVEGQQKYKNLGFFSSKSTGLTSDNPYLWKFTIIQYSDGTTSGIIGPILIGSPGGNGKDGEPGIDGQPGLAGVDGCVVFTQSYDPDVPDQQYFNDTRYYPDSNIEIRRIDVVQYRDEFYMVSEYIYDELYNKTRKYVLGPPIDANGNIKDGWQLIENYDPIKTSLIIAENAVFRIGQGNEFLLMGTDQEPGDTIVGGLSGIDNKFGGYGSQIRIYVGSQIRRSEYDRWTNDDDTYTVYRAASPTADGEDTETEDTQKYVSPGSLSLFFNKEQSPFRVYSNGKMVASDADIKGQLINKQEDSIFYTTLADGEIRYENKINDMQIIFTYHQPTKYPVTGKDAQGNNEVTQTKVPAIAFTDINGQIVSYLDYKGFHSMEDPIDTTSNLPDTSSFINDAPVMQEVFIYYGPKEIPYWKMVCDEAYSQITLANPGSDKLTVYENGVIKEVEGNKMQTVVDSDDEEAPVNYANWLTLSPNETQIILYYQKNNRNIYYIDPSCNWPVTQIKDAQIGPYPRITTLLQRQQYFNLPHAITSQDAYTYAIPAQIFYDAVHKTEPPGYVVYKKDIADSPGEWSEPYSEWAITWNTMVDKLINGGTSTASESDSNNGISVQNDDDGTSGGDLGNTGQETGPATGSGIAGGTWNGSLTTPVWSGPTTSLIYMPATSISSSKSTAAYINMPFQSLSIYTYNSILTKAIDKKELEIFPYIISHDTMFYTSKEHDDEPCKFSYGDELTDASKDEIDMKCSELGLDASIDGLKFKWYNLPKLGYYEPTIQPKRWQYDDPNSYVPNVSEEGQVNLATDYNKIIYWHYFTDPIEDVSQNFTVSKYNTQMYYIDSSINQTYIENYPRNLFVTNKNYKRTTSGAEPLKTIPVSQFCREFLGLGDENVRKNKYIFYKPQLIFSNGRKYEYATYWMGDYDPIKDSHKQIILKTNFTPDGNISIENAYRFTAIAVDFNNSHLNWIGSQPSSGLTYNPDFTIITPND